MSRIVAHNTLPGGSLENATCALGTNQSKLHVWREISIVQSIQLGFSRSLGSMTSNEANKRVMLHTEWTISASLAVLRLAQ